MTSREYVKAAIEHRAADYVPHFILFCPDAWDAIKAEKGDDVSREELVADDIASIGIPWWGWHELESDWRGAAAPTSKAQVKGSGGYADFENAVKRAHEETDKYVLVMIYGSHFEKANSARGIENFLADMGGEKEFAKKLLTTIIDKNMVMLENILANPEIDGILLGSDWGSQRGLLMSPACWEDMIAPGEQREYDLVHSYGKDVWVHSCGDIQAIIPRLVEMGLDVLNPVQPECMDIVKLKDNYGDKLAFWGGISTQDTLPYGTPDEVKAEARRVRDILSKDGGYILSPSQNIQGDVPVENIMALLEVAKEKVR